MLDISPIQRTAVHQRFAELTHATAIPMPDGPKWVCQLLPGLPCVSGSLTSDPNRSTHALLQQLKPLNIGLEHGRPTTAGWLFSAPADDAGCARAYALLRTDCRLEIVGVLPTGAWPPHQSVWWPGAYEIPLLEQIGSVFEPLLTALGWSSPAFLCMGLLALQDSALIALSQHGSERAYPIPTEYHTLEMTPVRLECDRKRTKTALVQALNHVRACAGVVTTHAFYL